MLAYTHTDEVERTSPNITPFQKHIEGVMCNDLGEFFNSMFQFSYNQNSDVLAINIQPIDQTELNRLGV